MVNTYNVTNIIQHWHKSQGWVGIYPPTFWASPPTFRDGGMVCKIIHLKFFSPTPLHQKRGLPAKFTNLNKNLKTNIDYSNALKHSNN